MRNHTEIAHIHQAAQIHLDSLDTSYLVVDLPALKARLEHLRGAMPNSVLHAIAIKTNPHPKVLEFLVNEGFGLEAASIEEVGLALQAGCPPAKLVFDSPVKTKNEIEQVAGQQGMLVNCNTLGELERYPSDFKGVLGIRVNPMLHTGSPELFNVSENESKFGVPVAKHQDIIAAVLNYPVEALHMHSGSQMSNLEAQKQALQTLKSLADQCNSALENAGEKRRIHTIDIGGGLPTEPLLVDSKMATYGAIVAGVFEGSSYQLVTEFGQWVHAEAGMAYSTVEYVVEEEDHARIFIHLGADFFMRDAYTVARPFPISVVEPHTSAFSPYDIAGPLCFAGDYLAKGIELPRMQEGMWLNIQHTGANCYALWSRHCSRSVPKLLAWNGHQMEVWSNRQEITF